MRTLERALTLGILLQLVLPTYAQISVGDPYDGKFSPRAQQLVSNDARLNVTLQLDRAVYFTGETAQLKITVTNPTVSVLEIRDPFDVRGPSLDLMSRDAKWVQQFGSEWGFLDPHFRAQYKGKHPDPPSVFLAPGHKLERQFLASESLTADHQQIFPGGHVPELPGDYRLVYSYAQLGRAAVDFKTIRPRVVASASLTSPRTEMGVREGDKGTYLRKRYTFVLAVEGDGAYWVIASLNTGATYPRLLIQGDVYLRSVSPFVRVARSNVPIVSVQGSLDTAENLTIAWVDQSGKTSTVALDKDRIPRGASPPLP